MAKAPTKPTKAPSKGKFQFPPAKGAKMPKGKMC
jgi:hypothetical protein